VNVICDFELEAESRSRLETRTRLGFGRMDGLGLGAETGMRNSAESFKNE
jgi:hypothetical protein